MMNNNIELDSDDTNEVISIDTHQAKKLEQVKLLVKAHGFVNITGPAIISAFLNEMSTSEVAGIYLEHKLKITKPLLSIE